MQMDHAKLWMSIGDTEQAKMHLAKANELGGGMTALMEKQQKKAAEQGAKADDAVPTGGNSNETSAPVDATSTNTAAVEHDMHLEENMHTPSRSISRPESSNDSEHEFGIAARTKHTLPSTGEQLSEDGNSEIATVSDEADTTTANTSSVPNSTSAAATSVTPHQPAPVPYGAGRPVKRIRRSRVTQMYS